MIRKDSEYGSYVSSQETLESGNECVICRDAYVTPIKLECNHIFCEDCIEEWFKREKTCPICRHEIKSAGKLLYADGSTNITIALF